jgi:hypothetical protein
LLSSILEGHPELRGVLFDLPHVAKSAGERLATLRIANRCEVEGGSFFERVPENLDVYILQYVLHDWDDERCRTILAACRAAMRTGSRLLIVEKPLPEGPDLGDLHWLGLRDIHMMLVHGGRERTLEQYDALLDSASFRRTSHRRLDAHLPDVIEALPA